MKQRMYVFPVIKKNDSDIKQSFLCWIDDSNRDFKGRRDCCVKAGNENANHLPFAVVKSENNITVKSGEKVIFDARKSYDPHIYEISFHWQQYKDSGRYDGQIKIAD